MAVSATSPVNQTQAANDTTSLGRTRLAENFDMFLTLLTTQLKNQDPTAPMDAADSMQQMSSFTMVEQITNLAAQNQKADAVNLIGRTVTYKDADDVEHTGTVEKVATAKDGTATLTVAGEPGIDPTSITQVA